MAKKRASKIKNKKQYDENFKGIRFPFGRFDAAIEGVKILRQDKTKEKP